MALSKEFVDQHISDWQQRLTSEIYGHRKHWPSHLFHHSPLENAVAIVRDGCLRSRNDEANQRTRDVAAPGVIDTRNYAHDFVRLYFRPKTPTQWNIEGTRKVGECKYGDEAHAPVLVMFMLTAQNVLGRPDIKFSNKNMQLADAVTGDDESFFGSIPFTKVFSEGSNGGDKSITDARCAEVLCTSPLYLEDTLRRICFRSEPERETFLHLLGNDRHKWEGYCQVSDALKVFQKEYSFVQTLRLTNDGVVFRLNPRIDRQGVKLKIDAWSSSGEHVIDFYNSAHAAAPENSANNWIFRKNLEDGIYLVEVRIEDHLAYQNSIMLGDSLF